MLRIKSREERLEDKKDRLRGQVAIGSDARAALDNKFLVKWFESSEKQLLDKWASTPVNGPAEIEVRENCHSTLQLLRGLRKSLEMAAEGGDRASRYLNELVSVKPGRVSIKR